MLLKKIVNYDTKTSLISILITLLNTIVGTNTEGNNSDVFVSYIGHSEAKDTEPILMPKAEYIEANKDVIAESHTQVTKEPDRKTETEDVVFIPNDKPVFRNGDEYLEHEPVHVADMINSRKISDIVRDDISVTESAKKDVLFISGKNNENAEKSEKKKNKHEDSLTKPIKTKSKGFKAKSLDCSNLDCDNTIKSVCGGKMDEKKMKYRLFLNECFFRKVNCAFKYPNNRYQLVELDKCSQIGYHSKTRPHLQPVAMALMGNLEETRRSFSSRRSLTAGINGQACSHACPVSCPERYEPQCAVSSTGQRHTFLNHCKLDFHTCLYRVAWYIRPLSECVGGRKADMQQNRGFIAWMQKVGVVDNRGRLKLTKT